MRGVGEKADKLWNLESIPSTLTRASMKQSRSVRRSGIARVDVQNVLKIYHAFLPQRLERF
jgi:hypothetical protein